ncbi:MAG: class I mannose-6-phosphate isomerase [Bacteroidales bacterium]|nr:class I mannose-6-phosphate isomerase [Bacteroidales bacterium]
MSSVLYPLCFTPITKPRVWGGERWIVSGLEGSNSLVSNGLFKENEINELIEAYMEDLVGDTVYQRFGNEFPLLVKILHIQDYLSFQVHPCDAIAKERHHAYGKAEVWYILDAEPDAKIYLGFNRHMSADEFTRRCMNQTLPEVVNEITPRRGDCFYIPPGTVHAAGGGVTVAEIQQVSDITYRVYDWGREFYKETAREMHMELALDAMNWEAFCLPSPEPVKGGIQKLAATPWFHLSKRIVKAPLTLSNTLGRSFRLLICIEGQVTVGANQAVTLPKGEVALIPAAIGEYVVTPGDQPAWVLEVFVP